MGAIGLMGSMASLVVLVTFAAPPASLSGYAMMRGAMAAIATWIMLPSLALTLTAGLLAIAVNRAYHDAGWAWVKAATGVLMFAGGLHALAPIKEGAERSSSALAGELDPATITGSFGAEQG